MSTSTAPVSTLPAKTGSPLLDLLGEIRDRIYDYLSSDVTIDVVGEEQFQNGKPKVSPEGGIFRQMDQAGEYLRIRQPLHDVVSISRTCRLLNSEMSLLWIFRANVVINIPNTKKFFDILTPAQRGAIRSLDMGIHTWSALAKWRGKENSVR